MAASVEEYVSLILAARAPGSRPEQRESAFCELILRFQDMAYGYALAVLGDSQLAEDAAQDAFISAYQNLGQLENPVAFPSWLRRIVYSRCNRIIRKRSASEESIELLRDVPSGQPNPQIEVERREMQAEIAGAIRQLPEKQRISTILYYIDGYSQNEVADFLDVSVDAVKKQIQRGRDHLQERLIDMVKDSLRENRPSNSDQIVQAFRLFNSLQEAAQQGELATIELMLVDGVDVNTVNDAGETLLHLAAQQGHVEVAEYLIARGISVNVKDNSGRTPLQAAIQKGYAEMAEVLRRHGGII